MTRGLVLAATLAFVLAWPGAAFAATANVAGCPARDALPAFAAWGDGASYAAVPGGAFTGDVDWTTDGPAGVAAQYNPFAQGDADDASAVLEPGSSLTSPPFCADRSIGLRFAARAVETGTHMRVDLISTDSEGKPDVEKVADLLADDFPTWGLTERISFKNAVGAKEAREVRLRLTATNGSGSWLADNVMMQTRPATKAQAPSPVAGACPDIGRGQVFSAFGDGADYELAPGGLFDGALSWSTTGTASVTDAGSPFGPDSENAASLAVNPGDTATSPPFCVSQLHPFLRFAARSGSRSTRLRVDVLYTDEEGRAERAKLTVYERDRFRAWSLTDRIRLDKCLPRGDAIRSLQLRISADRGSTVGWLVDDVYVDPVKKG